MEYRGWRSTKLHLSLITMALISGAYVYAGAPEMLFGEYAFAMIGAAGVFSGSAVATNFAARRGTPARVRPDPPD
jgi:hypothetical protein